MKTLILQLVGPIQSWGTTTRYGDFSRDTDMIPSKAGVVGLLASALGRSRFDDVSDIAALHMAVRVDSRGVRFRDYHTAHGTKSAEAYVTRRYYLSDAKFVVALSGDDDLIFMLAEAVQMPCRPLYLGRRSNIPSVPLFLGVSDDSAEDALCSVGVMTDDNLRRMFFGIRRFDVWRDVLPDDDIGSCITVKDVPLSFGPVRSYGYRNIVRDYVDVGFSSSDHDPVSVIEEM